MAQVRDKLSSLKPNYFWTGPPSRGRNSHVPPCSRLDKLKTSLNCSQKYDLAQIFSLVHRLISLISPCSQLKIRGITIPKAPGECFTCSVNGVETLPKSPILDASRFSEYVFRTYYHRRRNRGDNRATCPPPKILK